MSDINCNVTHSLADIDRIVPIRLRARSLAVGMIGRARSVAFPSAS
jgi:hypothetical protein